MSELNTGTDLVPAARQEGDAIGSVVPGGNPAARAVRVVMRDWGNGVNPLSLPPQPANPLEPGGLGMVCLRQLIDELAFEPQPDGMRLVMVKRKKPGVETR